MAYSIGIVGATGLVGQTFIKLLNQSGFQIKNLKPFASKTSAGKNLECQNKNWTIEALSEGCFDGLDIVFFSSGDDISLEWAPKAVAAGAYAIDNSAAFRMNPEKPLVVPEVNGHLLDELKGPEVIANPNCSTIQLVVALSPLHEKFGLKSVRVATYQAVSGAGSEALEELRSGAEKSNVFPASIAGNCIPQIGSFDEQGYCSEEVKIMNESKKILNHENLAISAFTVRVPVANGHCEAAWIELGKDVAKSELTNCLNDAPGIELSEDGPNPMTKQVDGKHPVYVGRIHKDVSFKNSWHLWVAADNLLKGAALNGLQIAERLKSKIN